MSVSPSSSHRSPRAKPQRYHHQFLALADAFFKRLTGARHTPRIPTSLCTHPNGASGLFDKLLACKPQAGKRCACYLSLFQIDHAMVLEITVDNVNSSVIMASKQCCGLTMGRARQDSIGVCCVRPMFYSIVKTRIAFGQGRHTSRQAGRSTHAQYIWLPHSCLCQKDIFVVFESWAAMKVVYS